MASEKELNRRIGKLEVPFREALRALEEGLERFSRALRTQAVGQSLTDAAPGADNRTLVLFEVEHAPIEDDKRRWRFTGFTRRRGPDYVDALIDALTRIRYEHDEIANRAPIVPGCIGVPDSILRHAQEVNDLKDRLAAVVAKLRPEGGRVMVRFTDTRDMKVKKRDISAALLHRAGETDVNLKAAYRHIPIVFDPVERVRFMHMQNRTVQSFTAAQLLDRVSGFTESDHKREDIAFLSTLDPDEVLSVASRTYERIRMKVRLRHASGSQTDRKFVGKRSFELPGELPLLYFYLPQTMERATIISPVLRHGDERLRKPRPPAAQNASEKPRKKPVLEQTPCLKTIPRCYRREFDPDRHSQRQASTG